MSQKKPRPAEAPPVAPQRPVARPDRGRGAQRAAVSRRTHDAHGKFTKGNGLGGRPPGSKDKRPRIGSIKAALEEFLEKWNGEVKLVEAIDRGVTASDPRKAIGFLELAAKLLDKAEDPGSRHVHFHLHTNVDFGEPAWPVGASPATLARRNGQEG